MNKTISANAKKRPWWSIRPGLCYLFHGLSLGVLLSGIHVYVQYKIREHAAEQRAAINARQYLPGKPVRVISFPDYAYALIKDNYGRWGVECEDDTGVYGTYLKPPALEQKINKIMLSPELPIAARRHALQAIDANGDRVITETELETYLRSHEQKQ
jgi:hypothetical protein